MRIVPVHPRAETVFGSEGYASLADIPDGTRVHVVDCFVNSSKVGAVVDQAIAQKDRLGIAASGSSSASWTSRPRPAPATPDWPSSWTPARAIEYPRVQPGDGAGAIAG